MSVRTAARIRSWIAPPSRVWTGPRGEIDSLGLERAFEEMFVDWAGDKLEVINGNTGQPWALEQFVAILGASELTYVEARESQGEEDWIE